MNESQRTTLFLKWAKARKNETFAAELKICKEKSLPFSAVKDHQKSALYRVKHGLFNWKISDYSRETKPFDMFQMARESAYIIIFWYWKRGDKRMSIIDIDRWLEEENKSQRKSITYERSCEIGRCLEL